MQKLLLFVPLLLVSVLVQGSLPSWTRDDFIDAGQLKAVNFEPFIKSNGANTSSIVTGSKTITGALHFNKTNFNSTPRVIVGIKAYGMLPISSVTGSNPGFRFNITGVNRTNLTFSVTTFDVTVIGLHYQYLAVVGYTNLYYMQLTTIYLNSSHEVFNGGVPGVRMSSFTYTNPGGMVSGDNFTSSQMVLQVWPNYFLFKPTTGTLSFNVTAVPASTSTFTITITAADGCGMLQLGISILYLNKTKIYANSYTQVVDFTTDTVIGNSNEVVVSTMTDIPTQYQYRNSAEGIQGIYLPFGAAFTATAWYFNTTSSTLSRLYYKAVQERYRLCVSPDSFLLVDDGLCYSSCPIQRYATNSSFKYCKQCHYSCLQCSSPDYGSFCTACNSSAMRTLSNNSCPCDRNYYQNGIELCAACDYTCLTCSSNLNTSCLTCDPVLKRNIVNATCPCMGGYYENNTCFACLNLCLLCSFTPSNQTYQCLSCNSSLFLQIDATQQSCTCFGGYYNNSNVCSKCIKGCLTCSNGNTCDSCDPGGNWVKNSTDSTCICADRFFESVGGNSSNASCMACDGTCLTCINSSPNSCISCDPALDRVFQNGTCNCMDGFYQNSTCLLCLNSCTKCLYNQSTAAYTCLSCNSSLFRVLDPTNSSCICQTGYYDNNGTCEKCMEGCEDCSNGVTCNTCNSTLNWVKDAGNVCVCDSLFFSATVNFTKSCQICDNNCLTCQNSSSTCLSCDTSVNRTLSNSSCPCSSGFYQNSTCFPCKNGCIQCSFLIPSQSYLCTKCNASLLQEIASNNMSCVCISGYYNSSGVCSSCMTGCLSCLDGVTCLSCDSGQSWRKNTTDSTCVCIDQYYQANATTCLPCQTGCLSCLLNTTTLQCLQCNSTAHFVLRNDTCTCNTGFMLVSTSCIANASSFACGNGVVESGEQCDDGNVDDFDGCSKTCQIETSHICLNNLTAASVCYYNGQITLSNEEIYKVPLQNRVLVSLSVSAPNCNSTFLEKYLQNSVSLALIPKTRRLLTTTDISSQSVQYNPLTGIAKLDFQYSQDIDLTKKEVQFVASSDYSQSSSRYFYASPSTVLTLTAPDNLLLTTYASPDEIGAAKTMSLAFAGMVGMMWVFWMISICYHQTASAVEFMLIAQIAYQALLQRKFISDGWVGLVIYGKYCYGFNAEYDHLPIFDRLRVLSLNSYLFHTLNITTALLFTVVVVILAVFCYETIKVNTEVDETGDLNATQAKIQPISKSKQELKDEQSQYKIKKGLTLVLFEIGTSFTLLTVKIVVMSLMLVSTATAIDVAIVSSLLAVCYFLVWYFVYRFYQYDFLDDFSFKRLLRDSEDTVGSRSLSGRVGNFFVKYYYLAIFFLLILFGVADGLPSFGAPFYITTVVISLIFLIGVIVFGVYFRNAHAVRAVCNLLALSGIMVLHLMESMGGSTPVQSTTGPIICICILYAAFGVNFGLMAYIELRRHRNKKPRYRNGKVAPADLILQFNYTEEPHLQPEENPVPELIREPSEQEPQEGQQVRRSDKSGESLVHDSKFSTLKSKSRKQSLSDTHKKITVPHVDRNQETKQKGDPYDGFVVIRQPVREMEYSGEYEERSVAERVEILDMSRSVSDFTKTIPKFNANDTFGAQPEQYHYQQRQEEEEEKEKEKKEEEEGVELQARDPEPSHEQQP